MCIFLQELKTVEHELHSAKNELKNYKETLSDRTNLENELTKLRNEMSKRHEENLLAIHQKEEEIKEQKQLIGEQMTMMQIMEEDIDKLEHVVSHLDEQLQVENKTKRELLDKLKVQEAQIAKAKSRREKSTVLLIKKLSHFAGTPKGGKAAHVKFDSHDHYDHHDNHDVMSLDHISSEKSTDLVAWDATMKGTSMNNGFRSLDPFDAIVCDK